MQLPDRFGKYLLLKELEVGGMAAVYLARARGAGGFERLLAIKRIFPHLGRSDEFVQMFIREAQLAAELSHPNVIHIYDLGKVEDDYFIAMEYIQGKDAFRLLRRCKAQGRPLPLSLACHIILQMLEGLDYAHRKRDFSGQPMQIVHRDVSPRNVLISYEGHVKLIDFGIAKAATAGGHTQVGTIKGKVNYMSPEQARGQELDARSDLFAAGLVLYELIHQRRLFKGTTELHTLELVRECVLPDFREENPELPPALAEILTRSLARDRNERFQTGREMAAALQKFVSIHQLAGTPVELAEFMGECFGLEQVAEQRDLESLHHYNEGDIAGIRDSGVGSTSDELTLSRQPAGADGGIELQPGDMQTLLEVPLESAPEAASAASTPSIDRHELAEPGGVAPIFPPGDAPTRPVQLLEAMPSRVPLVSGAPQAQPEVLEDDRTLEAGAGKPAEPESISQLTSGSSRRLRHPRPYLVGAAVAAVSVAAVVAFWDGSRGALERISQERDAVLSSAGLADGVQVPTGLTSNAAAASPVVFDREQSSSFPARTSGRAIDGGSVGESNASVSGSTASTSALVAPVRPDANIRLEPAPDEGSSLASARKVATTTTVARSRAPTSETSTSGAVPVATSDASGQGISSSLAVRTLTEKVQPMPEESTPVPIASTPAAPGVQSGEPAVAAARTLESGEIGFLNVNAEAPSRVRVDGKDTGQVTPVKRLKIPAGRHTVELERIADGRVRTYDVELRPQQVELILWRGGE